MPDDIDDALLLRHFAGTGTPDDELRLRMWLASDPAHAAQLERWREAWRVARELGPAWEVERALASVKARTGRRVDTAPGHAAARLTRVPPPGGERRPTRPHRAPRRVSWSIAAAAIFVAGIGIVWRATSSGVAPDASVLTRAYTTGTGQQAKITLTDGSLVTLGVRSSLRVPATFGAKSRDVFLDGEAYFDVAHDSTRPFAVHSGRAETHVLGTKFDVRDRPEDAAATVAVTAGRVRLTLPAAGGATAGIPNAIELTEGDVGRLTSSGTEVRHGVDVARLTGWVDGRIAFVDAPLPEVLAELERWYDVSLRVGDSTLARRHLTTAVQHETIDEMVSVLEAALEVRANRNGRVITLYPRKKPR